VTTTRKLNVIFFQ